MACPRTDIGIQNSTIEIINVQRRMIRPENNSKDRRMNLDCARGVCGCLDHGKVQEQERGCYETRLRRIRGASWPIAKCQFSEYLDSGGADRNPKAGVSRC